MRGPSKGHRRGEAHSLSKLTEANVRDIVQLMKTPCSCCGRKPTMTAVAKQFGVSAPLVCNIVNGKDWKHVTGGIL